MKSLFVRISPVLVALFLSVTTGWAQNIGPDLDIVELSILDSVHGQPLDPRQPVTFYGGDPINLRMVVRNNPVRDNQTTGTAEAFQVWVNLSTDSTIDRPADVDDETDDFRLLERHFVGPLEPGETTVYEWTQLLPGNFPGNFFLVAGVFITNGPEDVDTRNNVMEPNRFPGTATASLTILPNNFPQTDGISLNSSGRTGDGLSDLPSISDDNRFVAFASEATDLIDPEEDEDGNLSEPLVTNNTSNVFVRDRLTNETNRVSLSNMGAQGNAFSGYPQISGNGRFVAFQSNATNLVPGDTQGWTDIFVRDRLARSTTRVSVRDLPPPGQSAEANGPSFLPSITRDGRYIVFESMATNLTGVHTNFLQTNIYLRDRLANRTYLISRSITGGAANGNSNRPFINPDGTRIVYETRASNIVPQGGNGRRQIVVFNIPQDGNMVHGVNRLVSIGVAGDLGNENSFRPTLNADGRYVAFDSLATNLAEFTERGRISLSSRIDPDNGDTITIDDGDPNTLPVVFEFDNDEEQTVPDSILVALGGPVEPATGRIFFRDNPDDGDAIFITQGQPTEDGEDFESATFIFRFVDEIDEEADPPPPGTFLIVIGDNLQQTRSRLFTALFQARQDEPEARFLPTTVGLAMIHLRHEVVGSTADLFVSENTNSTRITTRSLPGRDDTETTRDNLLVAIRDSGLNLQSLAWDQAGISRSRELQGFSHRILRDVTPAIQLTHPEIGEQGATIETTSSAASVSMGLEVPSSSQVYLRDLQTGGRTSVVSLNRSGIPGAFADADSMDPRLSADGKLVTFTGLVGSAGSNPSLFYQAPYRERSDGTIFRNPSIVDLSEGNGVSDVYVARAVNNDRTRWEHERVSVNRFGLEANIPGALLVPQQPVSRHGVISPDGRFVLFASDGPGNFGHLHGRTNLSPSRNTNNKRDLFIHDRRTLGLPDDPLSQPPVVNLVAPTSNRTIAPGSDLFIQATAGDADGWVASLEIYVNGELIAIQPGPIEGLSTTWRAPDVAGTYLVYAVAEDNDGNRSVSGSIEVVVDRVWLRLDVTAERINLGESVGMELEILAGDPVIGFVEFVARSGTSESIIRRDTTAPYTASWTPQFAGIYELDARVWDGEFGIFLTVSPVTVEVVEPATAPVFTWAAVESGSTADLNGVTYFGGNFVAVGEGGAILTSTGGASWTERSSGVTEDLRAVSAGNGVFVAVGDPGPQGGTILTSQDGSTWIARASGTTRRLSGIAYGNGRFVAVGSGGVIRTSDDGGATWVNRPSSTSSDLLGVAYGLFGFVAVGESGTIVTSPGGASWTSRPVVTSAPLYDIVFGDGLYVAVGGRFAAGSDTARILTSADGVSWTVGGSGIPSIMHGVDYSAGAWVAIGTDGVIATSPDGFGWLRDLLATATTETLNGVTLGGGVYIAVGRNGAIVRSGTNFQTWLADQYAGENLEDSSISGPGADPDGSGVSNLVRYALGIESATDARERLPAAMTVSGPTPGAQYLALRYKRSQEAPDVLYLVEVSSDLFSWLSLEQAGGSITVEVEGDSEIVTARDGTPIAAGGESRFLRLRLEMLQ